MKIKRIEAANVFGLLNVDIDTTAPVQLIAGINGSGKSSIQNAVRLALTGQPSRVALKKDYGMMVREGNKKGKVSVVYDDDIAVFDLPKGKPSPVDSEALPFTLEPSTFAALNPDERKKLIFKWMGVKINREDIKKGLIKEGCKESVVDTIIPLLRSGFPAAFDGAKEKARDAKADWKSITNEAWGSDKAEDWEPEDIDYNKDIHDTKAEQLRTIDGNMLIANIRSGEISERKRQEEINLGRIEFLKKKVATLVRRQSAVDGSIKMVEEQNKMLDKVKKMAGAVKEEDILSCPCCSVALIDVDGELQEFQGVVSDGDTSWNIEKHEEALAGLQVGLANNESALAEVNSASIELAGINENEEIIEQGEDVRLKAEIEGLTSIRCELRSELSALEEQARMIDRRAADILNAAKCHAEVLGYLKIAELLSPSGLPSQILSKAVKPFNKRLKLSSDATEWKLTRITPDFDIEADGRPYCLLSESEKWRCDAMLAESISHLSGLKILMLDRMDVLDIPSRGVFINWMYDLAESGEIETALIFATLKSLPDDDEILHCEWLDSGSVVDSSEVAA